MKKSYKLQVASCKLRLAQLKRIFLIFSLFTIHCSLFTVVYAEEIKSRASVVMDAETGRVLYAKNPDLKLMPASTTKLMTALIVVEKANLSDVVTVSRKAVNTAPTRSGLKVGDRVTIETLLYAALMKSANDAAVALAEAVGGSEEEFVDMMNTKAIAIGAHDTRFINPNGLPGEGQHITAYDLSKIMRQAIKYPILKEIIGTRVAEVSTEAGKTIFVKNTNKLLWSDDELLGGKTGYTRQARHCFVCAGERDKGTIIVALLGAPSRDVLWKETEDLMAFGYKVMSNQEEPVVYVTKSDYDSLNVKKASYVKKTRYKSSRKKLAVKKASSKTEVSKAKTVKTGQSAKKKKKTKALAKKKTKKTNIAKKETDASKG
jgi:serine-type D-Ala-D-Ala carboxypeptidase (penicillin-binding protein 5/6)